MTDWPSVLQRRDCEHRSYLHDYIYRLGQGAGARLTSCGCSAFSAQPLCYAAALFGCQAPVSLVNRSSASAISAIVRVNGKNSPSVNTHLALFTCR